MATTTSPRTYDWRPALRLALWMVLGASAALLLALFMYSLIHYSELKLSETERIQMLDFVRLKREETPQRRDRKPERPEMNRAPDAPPMEQAGSDTGSALTVSAPLGDLPDAGIDVTRGGLGIGSGDGEYLPIVKVAPVYPRRALERGVTGTCLVRYTVTTAGTVRDVEVVEDQCSDPVFYQPSVEAARRFKYKPRVIDGAAVEVLGVHNLFHYERSPAQGGGGG